MKVKCKRRRGSRLKAGLDDEPFDLALWRALFYIINVIITVTSLLVCVVDTQSVNSANSAFPLAIALVQMCIFAAEELFDMGREVANSPGKKVGPVLVLAARIVVFGGSFLLLMLLLLLPKNNVIILIAVCSFLLIIIYIPLIVYKVIPIFGALRIQETGGSLHRDYIAEMIGGVNCGTARRAKHLYRLRATSAAVTSEKRKASFYDDVWETIIAPEIIDWVRYGASCSDLNSAKEAIWYCYNCLNLHVSENYMQDHAAPLDRHKIAACYLCAILCASPLDVNEGEGVLSFLGTANERLAITVCCSVLAAFTSLRLRRIAGRERDWEKIEEEADRILNNGIVFPAMVGHGANYEESVIKALRAIRIERSYNPMVLALLMFDWERNTVGEELFSTFIASYAENSQDGNDTYVKNDGMEKE